MSNNIPDLSAFLKAAKTTSKPQKNSLGRGLSALLGENNYTQKNTVSNQENSDSSIIKIEIKDCLPSPYQARKNFNEESLQELASSIKEKGVIQPIIVRNSKLEANKYEIIAGERRCRASKLANIINIPAIVMDLDDKQVMEIGLIENLQRQDLNPVEEAMAYSSLYNDFGYTHEQIANTLGKSRSYITNYLRILNLPTAVLDLLANKQLSFGHAKMLVNVHNPLEIANKIIADNLSVKETEELSQQQKDKNLIAKTPKKEVITNPELVDLVNNINNSYSGLKASYSVKNNNSGEIKIKYQNIVELKQLLNTIS